MEIYKNLFPGPPCFGIAVGNGAGISARGRRSGDDLLNLLMLLLTFSSFLQAAEDCQMSAGDYDAALKQRLKFFVVYEGEKEMLLSVFDEEKIAAEGRKKGVFCVKRALDLEKAAKLPADGSLAAPVRSLLCSTTGTVAITFNVKPKEGLAVFVRSYPEGVSELSLGGVRIPPPVNGAPAACEKIFWEEAGKALALSNIAVPKLKERFAREKKNLLKNPKAKMLTPEERLKAVLKELFGEKTSTGPARDVARPDEAPEGSLETKDVPAN